MWDNQSPEQQIKDSYQVVLLKAVFSAVDEIGHQITIQTAKEGGYDSRMGNRSMQIILVRPSQAFILMRSNTVRSIFGGPATVSENSFEYIIMG